MSRPLTVMVILSVWLGTGHGVLGQPNLERLEKQLQQRRPAAEDAKPRDGEKIAAGAKKDAGEGAKSKRGYLGVVADDKNDRGRGVRILEVLPGGPADKGQLKADDLITALGGVQIRQMSEMAAILEDVPPGGKIAFEVLRGRQKQTVEVTLGQPPPADQRRFEHLRPPAAAEGPADRPPGDPDRIAALRRRIEQLEQRVAELERRLLQSLKKRE